MVFIWENAKNERILVAVNYVPHTSQCHVRLPYFDLACHDVVLNDLMGNDIYIRDGSELLSKDLYLELPAWGYHLFKIE